VNNKAQISVEYLTMLAISILLAGIILLLVLNFFSLKDGLVNSINEVRDRILQV